MGELIYEMVVRQAISGEFNHLFILTEVRKYRAYSDVVTLEL